MLKNEIKKENKLIPLRKFSVPGVYSSAYLSQLVQRKKLKAEKIGRNYFTTEKWFNDYIEKHARDEKQESYEKHYLKKQNQIEEKRKLTLGQNSVSARFLDQKRVNFFVLDENSQKIDYKERYLRYQTLAVSVMIVVIMIAANVFYLSWRDEGGQVAGESEEVTGNFIDTSVASSTDDF